MSAADDKDRLACFLESTLERVVNIFKSFGVDVPDRQLVTVGQPVYDCEQVAVSLIQLYFGMPGQQEPSPQRCDGPVTAVITVQVLRKVPVGGSSGQPPSADALTKSAAELVTDAWILTRTMKELDEFGLGVIADVTAAEPQGGFGGPVLTFTMAVP
jgi:hypothetical protein